MSNHSWVVTLRYSALQLGSSATGDVLYYHITHTHPFIGPFSGTTRVSRCQKGKPIWILLKQETVSGSGISWAVCKSAPCSRQITTPAPHHSVFLQVGCPSYHIAHHVISLSCRPSYHITTCQNDCVLFLPSRHCTFTDLLLCLFCQYMAAYRRVNDSRHIQADCQEQGSAPEPYARQSSMGHFCLHVI